MGEILRREEEEEEEEASERRIEEGLLMLREEGKADLRDDILHVVVAQLLPHAILFFFPSCKWNGLELSFRIGDSLSLLSSYG